MILQKFVRQWKELLRDRKYVISLVSGIAIMMLALIANSYASAYTEQVPALSVGDLILDHIPIVDLTFLYTKVYFSFVTLIFIYPLLFKPERLPFTIKTYAAFIIIRSFL